jgi:hypothetical protein
VGDRGPGHERRADHVRVERAPPRGGVDVDELRQMADGGRVDESVDPAEPGCGLVDRGRGRLLVGDVAGRDDGAGPRLLGGGLEPVAPAGEERDPGAPPGEPDRDGAAQPARRSDDHGSHPATSPSLVTHMLDSWP